MKCTPERFAEAEKALEEFQTKVQAKYAAKTTEEQQLVQQLQQERTKVAHELGEVFAKLENSPCHNCGRCCTALGGGGYFKEADLHSDVLSGQVSLLNYVVPLKTGEDVRCLFLSERGCNVPQQYRSFTCLGYHCSQLDEAMGLEEPAHWGSEKRAHMVPLFQITKKLDKQAYSKENPWRPWNPSGNYNCA